MWTLGCLRWYQIQQVVTVLFTHRLCWCRIYHVGRLLSYLIWIFMNGRYNYETRGMIFVTNSSCVCGHFLFFFSHRNEQLENSWRILVSIIPGFDQKLLAWHRETSLDLLAREACTDCARANCIVMVSMVLWCSVMWTPRDFEGIVEAVINVNEALEAKDYQKISWCHAELTKMLEEEKLSGMLLQYDTDIEWCWYSNPAKPGKLP